MADNARALATRIANAAKALSAVQRDAVMDASVTMKRYLLDAAEQQAGPDRRMRNVGKKGAALGVGFDVKGTQKPVALMKARGPWALRESNVPGHEIKPRRTRALAMPDGEFRGAVRHPGTRGVKRWAPARERGHPATVAVLRKKNLEAVRKVMS